MTADDHVALIDTQRTMIFVNLRRLSADAAPGTLFRVGSTDVVIEEMEEGFD
jgi:hypothetical protein